MEDLVYQQLYDLEDGHWWFRGRRAVLWAMLRRAGLPDAPRVLDAGCGTGRNLAEFGALGTAQGVDPSPQAIEFCRRRGLAGVRGAGIEALPFADGAFDLILATDVLEHVERDDVAAARAAARRRAGRAAGRDGAGVPLAVVPARRLAPSPAPLHARRAARAPGVAAAGARCSQTYFNSLLLPPIALVRTLARRRAPRDGRTDYELTEGPLNRAAGAADARRGER